MQIFLFLICFVCFLSVCKRKLSVYKRKKCTFVGNHICGNMNPDLEKLIKMAGEGAGLTEKKREIILRKAQELGEDMAEVEMVLENLSVSAPVATAASVDTPVKNENKRRKCPNCGSVLSDYTLTCPQCGYVLDAQSNTSSQVQSYIEEFNKRMIAVEKTELFGKNQKRIELINGFNVPVTKEALVLGLTYAKAQFMSAKTMDSSLAAAWLGKCQLFMDLLKSQSNLDDATRQFITANEPFLNENVKKKSKINLGSVMVFLILLIILLTIVGTSL